MSKIVFTKAVASGNDFIILDNKENKLNGLIEDFSRLAKKVCKRKLSIGADGLLVLADSQEADFKMRVFNPDGSEVTMCGNGARCSALYAYKNNWCSENFKMETGAGIVEASINGETVKLKMTEPAGIKLDKDLGLGDTIFKAHYINTGVPHVVHFLKEDLDIATYPVKEIGRKVRYHKSFEPEGANANFVTISGKDKIVLRTYERGVEDETLACGTGATASAIISHLVKGTKNPTSVITKSGDTLKIYFDSNNKKISNVYLEGSAKIIYEGSFNI